MASNSTPMTANPALATPRAEEPASEWASSTLSALEPPSNAQSNTAESSQEPGSHSAATTPGLNVPGSFPGQYPKPGAVQQDVKYAKDAAWNALETARGYAQTAAETAGGYLPASVSAYLPGSTPSSPTNSKILPSKDTSATDSTKTSPISTTTNNGAIPPASSVGIPAAVMPETSASTHEPLTSMMDTLKEHLPSHDRESAGAVGATAGVGDLPGHPKEAGVAKLPEERVQEKGHKAAGGLGTTAGVGALPGSDSEASVAKLPEERAQEAEKTRSIASTTDGASIDASIKSLPGSKMNLPPTAAVVAGPVAGLAERSPFAGSDKKAEKPDMAHHPEEQKGSQVGQVHLDHSPRATGRDHALAQEENTKFGTGAMKKDAIDGGAPGSATSDSGIPAAPGLTGKHTTASSVATPGHEGYPPQVPTKDHVGDNHPSRGVDSSAPDARDRALGHSAGHGRASTSSSGQGSNTSTSSPTKKHGFMDKLKGEVKVISGKLGGNEEKVEEGRRMMGKN